MTWANPVTVYAESYATLSPSAATYVGQSASAATFTSLSAVATTYTSTMTLSSATVVAGDTHQDHRLSRVYPIGASDLGINFVYRVRHPGDWTVRTDRPIPITSQISDSP